MKKINKVLLIILAVVAVLFISLFIFTMVYKNNYKLNIADSYEITIEDNSTASDVINDLVSDGVLDSEFLTKVFLKLNPEYGIVGAGDYKFSSKDNLKTMFEQFYNGPDLESVTFQIIEGQNLKQYSEVLATAFGDEQLAPQILAFWDSSEFYEQMITDYAIVTEEIKNEAIYHPLEGYFKPDTYIFNKSDFNMDNLAKISARFIFERQKDFDTLKENGASFDEHFNTVHKVLTIASIVEHEAKTYEDRQLVTGVFINRLDDDINLGSDVTTYYAAGVDFQERDLLQTELDSENGYNTRGPLKGLPVGPVNNPSREAMSAVLNYKANDYYYFVSDKNGKMYYSKTYAEHTKTVARLKEDDLWYEWDS